MNELIRCLLEMEQYTSAIQYIIYFTQSSEKIQFRGRFP